MFPIRPTAPATVAAPLRMAADLPMQAANALEADTPALAAMYDDLRQMLRNGDPVAGPLRAATLAVLAHSPSWPETQPIRLHTEGDHSGRCYGPRVATHEHVESVHVSHGADGCYAAAPRADAAWTPCGADANGLFEAALLGLQQRDALSHATLTDGLRSGKPTRNTDAQWLREALADFIERDRASAMRALAPVLVNHFRAHKRGPVDARLLREIEAMGPHRVKEVGRWRLAKIYNVQYSGLAKKLTSVGTLKDPGWDTLRREEDPTYRPRPIDPHQLRQLHDLGADGIRALGGLDAIAAEHQWSIHTLRNFLSPTRGLSAEGKAYIDRVEAGRDVRGNRALRLARTCAPAPSTSDAGRASPDLAAVLADLPPPDAVAAPRRSGTRRVDAALLQKVADMGPEGIRAAGGLRGIAESEDVAYSILRTNVRSNGRLFGRGWETVEKATHPHPAIDLLTADTLLTILRERERPAARTLDALARAFRVSFDRLRARLYADLIPKASGLDLLWDAQRTWGMKPITTATLLAVDGMVKRGLIPTPYHMLLAADAYKVSFDSLNRYVRHGTGLTRSGMRALGDLPAIAVPPLDPFPDPTQPLRLFVDADLVLEVRPTGTTWTASLVSTRAHPAAGAPAANAMPPATDAIAPASPGLPEELMDIPLESLMFASPEPVPAPPKRPRLDP